MYVYIHMYMCVYIYIYIYKECRPRFLSCDTASWGISMQNMSERVRMYVYTNVYIYIYIQARKRCFLCKVAPISRLPKNIGLFCKRAL